MKALVARSYGPVENLTLADVPKPTPGPGHVLVRTEASALNAIDLALITGAVKDHLPIQHPFVPGVDVTGVVEAVGEGVSRFSVGDRILAWNGVPSGGLAEYTLVQDAPSAALRPATLSPAESAGLPTAALTAAALIDEATPRADEKVLVVGASGGSRLLRRTARQADRRQSPGHRSSRRGGPSASARCRRDRQLPDL